MHGTRLYSKIYSYEHCNYQTELPLANSVKIQAQHMIMKKDTYTCHACKKTRIEQYNVLNCTFKLKCSYCNKIVSKKATFDQCHTQIMSHYLQHRIQFCFIRCSKHLHILPYYTTKKCGRAMNNFNAPMGIEIIYCYATFLQNDTKT